MPVKNVTEFSVRYMGYSFFRGAVHMWQRAKSNEQLGIYNLKPTFKESIIKLAI